jgi:hypothetical protein
MSNHTRRATDKSPLLLQAIEAERKATANRSRLGNLTVGLVLLAIALMLTHSCVGPGILVR